MECEKIKIINESQKREDYNGTYVQMFNCGLKRLIEVPREKKGKDGKVEVVCDSDTEFDKSYALSHAKPGWEEKVLDECKTRNTTVYIDARSKEHCMVPYEECVFRSKYVLLFQGS